MAIMVDTSGVARRALISGKDQAWLQTALKQATMAGFQADSSDSAEEALKRLAFIPYELVLLDDQVIREDKRLLPYLVNIPMQLRRKALYLLTGPQYKTMDAMAAFALGVDGLVNYKDLSQLAAYLHMLQKEHKVLYREFMNFVD